MLITVAVCTWNRAALLDSTLAQMRELTIPPGVEWELLVVNNNCTDDTDGVIARHAPHLPLRRLFEPKPGHSNARNCAVEAARGEFILWTDDDVLVNPDWLAALADAAGRHPQAVTFGGPIDPWFPSPPDPDLMEVFPTLARGFCGLDLGPDERPIAPGEFVFGANMAFRTGPTRHLRFDPELGRKGEFLALHDDTVYQEEVRAAGGAGVWVPGMRVRHYVEPSRMTLGSLMQYYYGLGASDVRRDGPPAGARLFGAPRYLFRMCAGMYLDATVARLRGERRRRFLALRGYSYYRGVIRGCRAIRGGTAR